MSVHEGRSDDARSETPNHAGWATFEARVRGRRFGRCIERANLAVDLGRLDEARAAVYEAKTLSPDAPEIIELENRLGAQSSPNAVLLSSSMPVVDSDPGWPNVMAGVAVLVVLFGVLGFGFMRLHYQRAAQPFSAASIDPATDVVGKEDEKGTTSSVKRDTPSPGTEKTADDGNPIEAPAAAVETMGPEPEKVAPRPPATSLAANDRAVVLAERRQPARSVAEAPPRAPFRSPSRPDSLYPPPIPAIARASVVSEPVATSGSSPINAGTPSAASEESIVAIPTSTIERTPELPQQVESERIRWVLLRYESAYNRLDAKAAGSVWPRVDQAALGRAFDGLITQRVSLGLCQITVIGNIGGASCAGKARWEPKVGGGLQTADRHWSFNLRKTDDGWKIEELRVR